MTSVAFDAVARNAPCPCGSGLRYKHCHGAAAVAPPAGRAAPAPPARPVYRPAGNEWDAVDPARREQLARWMEEALAHQTAGDDAEAEHLYRQVLAQAPRTHDALHMLAVARWRRGDLYEARELIEQALATAEPYESILKNVDNLGRAIDAQERRGGERIAEHALPLMRELAWRDTEAAAAAPRRPGEPLHVVFSGDDPDGDAARVFARLVDALAPWRPVAWQPADCAPLAQARTLDPVLGRYPVGGLHIHVGLEQRHLDWLARATPRRVVAIGVCSPASGWLLGLRRLAREGAVPLRPVFLSPGQAAGFDVEGPLLPAWPETPIADDGVARPWTLGVQVNRERRDPSAPFIALLGRLDDEHVPVALREPGRLRHALGDRRALRFVSGGRTTLEHFLGGIDALLVPPRSWLDEGIDREIALARASGLPVLLPRPSIHCPRGSAAGFVPYEDADSLMDAVRGLARSAASGRRAPSAAALDLAALAHALALGPAEAGA